MRRAVALIGLLLAVPAHAAPGVVFVDGRERGDLRLVRAAADEIVLARDGDPFPVPASAVTAIRLAGDEPRSAVRTANLYAAGGDRLYGTVTGDGGGVRIEGGSVEGYRLPLERVRAVRFGRLLAGPQQTYEQLFRQELARNRDVVIVQRDTRPFPVLARVLAVEESGLRLLIGDRERTVEADKVYAFVRQAARATEAPRDAGLHLRAELRDGGVCTLPLERIDERSVAGGGVRIDRAAVHRIELLGDHVARIGAMEPIDWESTVALGPAPAWRRDAMVLGGPLRLDGRRFEHGVGVHAHARLEYVLGMRWKRFFVRCGIDDAAGPDGRAVFRVLGDGVLLGSVEHRRGEPSRTLLVDVEGVDRLVLEARPAGDYVSDFCDWVEGRVFRVDPPAIPERPESE